MTSKKRQDRFFGAGSTPPPAGSGTRSGRGKGAHTDAEKGARSSKPSDSFEIVDSEGRAPQASRPAASSSPAPPPSPAPQSPRGAAPPPVAEEPPPYIPDPRPRRRSSLGWAWLTIVVTLVLAVGSYWFYEVFDGNPEKVRERFQAFSNRLVPAPRMTPLPEEPEPSDRTGAPAAVAAADLDPEGGLPVVDGGAAESAPDEAASPARTEPAYAGPSSPAPQVGIALDGSISGLGPAPESTPGSGVPTRPLPIAPTRREAPPGSTPPDDEGGWFRTTPSFPLNNQPDTQADPTTVQVAVATATPPPATATPQAMPSLPTRREDPDANLRGETASPLANQGAESPVTSQPPASAGAPAVALPSELASFKPTPTPTATPTPTPAPAVPPSAAGMTQMSMGKITAGASLVDLGLVYASKTLSSIQRNFAPPFAKKGATCVVSFLIRSDGVIYGSKIERSSGSDGLDSSALRAVSRATPLEPLPATVRTDAARVMVSFDF